MNKDIKGFKNIRELIGNKELKNVNNICITFSNEDNLYISKEEESTYLYINRNYYEKHKKEIDIFLLEFIKKYKKEEIIIKSGRLINDDLIKELCKNSKIKRISLAKFGFFDKYSLSKKHYEMFKKTNKELIKTQYVDKELEEVFDPMIEYNQEKFLYSYIKYRDLKKDSVSFYGPIPKDKLYILKYLGEDTTLLLSSSCNIKEIIETLQMYNKNNKIKIRAQDKNILNKEFMDLGYFDYNNEIYENITISINSINNINLPIKKYIEYEYLLYSIIEPAKDMSPLEKYIYAYDIVKHFKKYNTPKKDNKNAKNLSNEEYTKIKGSSRDLYLILDNDYIVCVGFTNFLSDLLMKLGISCIDLSVDVDLSPAKARKQLNIPDEKWKQLSPEEKYKIVNEQEIYIPKDKFGKHARLLVHIKDEKYGIDGIYCSDPTWDNNLDKNIYTHAFMTESDISKSLSTNGIDISNLLFYSTSIEEYNLMLNKIMDIKSRIRREEYDKKTKKGKKISFKKINDDAILDLYIVLNNFLTEFGKLFEKEYAIIKRKYPCLEEPKFKIKNIYKLSDELKNVLYEVADIISSKNNKKISESILRDAIKVVYKDAYENGIREEELDKMMNDTEERRIIEFGPKK